MQDHPHVPVPGGALAGCQCHRAVVPAGIKHVLGRGAEGLIEGGVVAGSLPLVTGSGFFQVDGGPGVLHLYFTDELA